MVEKGCSIHSKHKIKKNMFEREFFPWAKFQVNSQPRPIPLKLMGLKKV